MSYGLAQVLVPSPVNAQQRGALMDYMIYSIDGHAFRRLSEQDRNLEFIRAEGAALLAYFAKIDDLSVRKAVLNLVKTTALSAALDTQSAEGEVRDVIVCVKPKP